MSIWSRERKNGSYSKTKPLVAIEPDGETARHGSWWFSRELYETAHPMPCALGACRSCAFQRLPVAAASGSSVLWSVPFPRHKTFQDHSIELATIHSLTIWPKFKPISLRSPTQAQYFDRAVLPEVLIERKRATNPTSLQKGEGNGVTKTPGIV